MNSKNRTIGTLLSISSLLILLGMVFGGLGADTNLVHQLLVTVGGSLAAAVYLAVFKRIWSQPILRVLLTLSVIFLGLQAILGQVLVGTSLVSMLRGIHFAVSVLALGAISASTGYYLLEPGFSVNKIHLLKDQFSRHAIVVVLAAYGALISGVFLAEGGLGITCDHWLLCSTSWPPQGLEWIFLVHRVVVGIVAVFLLRFASFAWKEKRADKLLLTLATSISILYLGQGYIGALLSVRGDVDGLATLHGITSALIIVAGGFLFVASTVKSNTNSHSFEKSYNLTDKNQRVKDFLALNKPIVVLLLLATTLGGMVMGNQGFPPLRIVLVTLLAGALAAGGSGAVNQFIDKDLDKNMARTSNRPIPAGRLTPAEGLAYGVGALLVSFFLMAGMVNMLSAILTLAGMAYYVFLYSIVLKKRSVQNIVIGGGAGAIPPLVGWAAATGTLNLTAGFLFLIIFLWTPPHFWALALTRKSEYAAAGVPMMPVERGNRETERLILIYSIILVGSTILMWGLGLTGWLFLASAFILGIYIIWLSWQVYRNGRNKVYYRMYRHSNYYLLFLFIFLAIDSVLI